MFFFLTQILFIINAKFLKFSDTVALENCLLISKSFQKTLPKILSDWFTLSFESHTCNNRWTKPGCVNVPFHRTKTDDRYF